MKISQQPHEYSTRYVEAGRLGSAFNAAVAQLTRLGVGLAGARVLRVRGRKSGEWREAAVNPLRFDGEDYLVAPRGHTQWVRNLRSSGAGELRIGRRYSEFTAVELADEHKTPILREYLRRWGWEVGAFFEGVDKNATDEDLERIAPGFPVFRITVGRFHRRK